MSQKEAESAFNGTFDVITEELAAGNDVQVAGFGAFKLKHKDERPGRNPATGESITIKASVKAAFSQAKALKDVLNP